MNNSLKTLKKIVSNYDIEKHDVNQLIGDMKRILKDYGEQPKKYNVEFYNVETQKWLNLGNFKNYDEISNKVNLSYNIVRNIKLNKCKSLQNFIRISNNNDIIDNE